MGSFRYKRSKKNEAVLSVLILLLFIKPSSAKTIFRRFIDLALPIKTVSIRNDAGKPILYKCSFEGDIYVETLRVLAPGEALTWAFREYFAPQYWCFLYYSSDKQGCFWAYTVRKRCTYCYWSLKDSGPFLYRPDRLRWEQHSLFKTPNQINGD